MSTSSLKTLLLSSAVGLFALGVALSQSDILLIPTNFGTHTPKLAEIYLGTTTGGQVIRLGVNKEVVIPEGLIAGQASGVNKNQIAPGIINAAIGGGDSNIINWSAENSTIGAGFSGTISAANATIGAGRFNKIGLNGFWSLVAGGESNTISSQYSSIWGGQRNIINAQYGVIPGGINNTIDSTADYSFVAGAKGVAKHAGTFIWSDYSESYDYTQPWMNYDWNLQSTTWNTFLIRALNGMAINTTTVNPGVNVAINGTISLGSEDKLKQSCGGANGALLSGTLESRNGCMYYCDGKYRQLLNRKNSEIAQRCGENAPSTIKLNIAYKLCTLKENIDGSIYSIEYEPGETVIAYPQRIANSCTRQVITCDQDGSWSGSPALPAGGEWSIQCLAGSGASTPITYGCMWHVPNNADLFAGDEGGTFISDVLRTVVGANTAAKCEYACKANYHKDPTSQNCISDAHTFTCGTKPAGSVWNMGVYNGSYPQTRNGSAWIPATSTPTYNTTASTTECRYKCPVNYTRNGSSCVIPTRTFTCSTTKPANTVWNSVSSYTQTQVNGVWTPADSTTQYNPEATATSCRYTCASGYAWDGSACRISQCSGNITIGGRTYTLPTIGHGEAVTRNPNTNPVNTPTNGKTNYSATFTCTYGTWTYEEDAVITCNAGYRLNAAGNACVEGFCPGEDRNINGHTYKLEDRDPLDSSDNSDVVDPDYNPNNPPSVPDFGFTLPVYNDPRIYTMVLDGSPFATPSNGKTTYYMSFRCVNTQWSDYGTEQRVIVCNEGYELNGTTCQPKNCPLTSKTLNGRTYVLQLLAHNWTRTVYPTGNPFSGNPTNGFTSYWTVFTCNLGVWSNSTEQSSKNCNSWYHLVGNVCEPDCAAEYSLASCPANGNCTICGGKYKLESCVSPYTKNGNTCTLNLTGPYVLKARGTLGTPNVYTNMPGSVPADGPNSITVPAGAFKTGTPGVSYTRFSVAVFSCRGTNASDCATFNDYNKTDCPDSNGGNALFGVWYTAQITQGSNWLSITETPSLFGCSSAAGASFNLAGEANTSTSSRTGKVKITQNGSNIVKEISIVQQGVAANGVCWSSNGLTLSSKPTTNLCTVGTASTVAGSWPRTWFCNGSNGGNSDECTAFKQAWGACFIAGTEILLADGSKKNIEEVKIGEQLLGAGRSINTVLDYYRPNLSGGTLYSINGRGYFVTDSHPFMTLQWWKSISPVATEKEMPGFSKNMAGTLQIGDILIKNNGFEKVFTIERSNPITNLQLYNFIVDGTNSYYANGYLVHNKTAKYDCPANTGCCPICDEIYGSSSEDQVKCYNSCVTKCEAGQNYYNIQVWGLTCAMR